MAGAALGAVLAEHAPGRFLRVFFGLFELLVAAQLALAPRPNAHRDLPGTGAMWLEGTGIGALSTLLGIGGGTLTVPLLVYCNVPIHQVVGTSAACGLPIALAGAIGFVVAGWGEAGLPARSSGYLYWPAVAALDGRRRDVEPGGDLKFSLIGLRELLKLVERVGWPPFPLER